MDEQDQNNIIPIQPPEQPPVQAIPTPNPPINPKKRYTKTITIISIFVAMFIFSVIALLFDHKTATAPGKITPSTSAITKTNASGTQTSSYVPASINPVNPASIPLGDGKVSTQPQIGYVDSCISNFSGGQGSEVDGPWINQSAKTWNSETKVAVQGSVKWSNSQYSVTTMGNYRMITTNDIPNHPTGVFPISTTDPAYTYDKNPNSIKPQPTSWMLTLNPTALTTPECTNGGPVGLLNDGVFLYNALDGQGRDAGAHETLDSYQGHPDQSDSYHHHEVPTFMLGSTSDKSTSTLVGYAIDGYGIYVERDANGNLLTNANLDACHGRTSWVMWNGKLTYIYHYDATMEYPYTIGCFHGTPIKTSQQMKM